MMDRLRPQLLQLHADRQRRLTFHGKTVCEHLGLHLPFHSGVIDFSAEGTSSHVQMQHSAPPSLFRVLLCRPSVFRIPHLASDGMTEAIGALTPQCSNPILGASILLLRQESDRLAPSEYFS